MRRPGLLVAALALGAVVVPTGGCSCADPGPTLGRGADGGLAVGWTVDGTEAMTSVQLLDGDAVQWRIDAVDPAPRVVAVGQDNTGFETMQPLGPRPSLVGLTLRVEYSRAGAVVAPPWSTVLLAEEVAGALSPAAVEPYDGCGLNLPDFGWLLAGIIGMLGVAALGVVAGVVVVLGGLRALVVGLDRSRGRR